MSSSLVATQGFGLEILLSSFSFLMLSMESGRWLHLVGWCPGYYCGSSILTQVSRRSIFQADEMCEAGATQVIMHDHLGRMTSPGKPRVADL